MTRYAIVLIAIVLSAAVPAYADGGKTVVVQLGALNGSGESGTATLKSLGAKTLVTIRLSNGGDTEQPAHFHTGTCDKYAPRPLHPLNDVVNGKSETTLNVPIDKLTGGDLIVNVHKSYADIATQASCGVAKA